MKDQAAGLMEAIWMPAARTVAAGSLDGIDVPNVMKQALSVNADLLAACESAVTCLESANYTQDDIEQLHRAIGKAKGISC